MQTQETLKFRRRREAMVAEQLQARGIHDAAVLAAMGRVPRHFFVSEALMDQAYGDYPLPIGYQQTISQPQIVAEMTQALGASSEDRVLEIGTGSGYQAAVLAEMVFRVYTIERLQPLYMKARRLFDALKYHNIVTRYSDGTTGWKSEAPFDAILVTAGGPLVPDVLLSQLAEGGRLVMPVGSADVQQLVRVTRTPSGFEREVLCSCRFVKLVGEHGWREE
ncbi:protein-L-isoaspartate(D-aspartate) O-methyltransferase [Desulfobotulus alkaliphilus]|uniref:Protein-L-isoaspartate O-methyltransferase n=1 Tax=Desulfobotulus alkaliphilus TaxID=622671 RepID=A0A562RAX8_9BACT|nr:protein-L-isoaspartate(D-aspartate) O-methyltransferase [Desulfobotulus alkaliphilus]TWI66063.1 protein-L-isoaspartate(D-aspartate) O-methyltransferase [Desulfobotulus alkaliphilus]